MTMTYDEFVRGSKQANDEFVLHMLQQKFGRKFDQNQIWDSEELICHKDLKSGDILYFDLDNGKKLLGLALTDNKFIYVGNSGLKESNLNSDYWSNRLIGIRRIKQGVNSCE